MLIQMGLGTGGNGGNGTNEPDWEGEGDVVLAPGVVFKLAQKRKCQERQTSTPMIERE